MRQAGAEIDDQGADIQRVARQMVRHPGTGAYSYLCECAQMAKLSGDRESAITGWDIALAVVELMNERAAPA